MRTLKSQSGMSLVEATIILLVLMLLTSVLAPSFMDYLRDAQGVKVKEDCEAIGTTVMRLVRDVGSCLKMSIGPCTRDNRADILYSDGPAMAHVALAPGLKDYTAQDVMLTKNWDHPSNASPMVSQFTTDKNPFGRIIYADEASSNPAGWSWPGPQFNLGWRGAYLPSPIGPDPWGHSYLVNSGFLATALDATKGNGIGQSLGGWPFDVFCISAGINGQIETAYNGTGHREAPYGVERGGDDLIYVISGSTR